MWQAFLFFPYFLSYLFALLTAYGFLSGGWGYYSGFLLFFVLHPFLDSLFADRRPPRGRSTPPSAGRLFLLPSLPLLLLLLWIVFIAARGLSAFEAIGLILSMGTVMAVLGINIAHELVHRRSPFLRAYGVGLLLLCNFAPWGVAHVAGHHKNVGTPEDPATARKNESLYAFWWREFSGIFRETLDIEGRRLRAGQGPFPWWRHRLLIYFVLELVLAGGIFHLWGGQALLAWLAQSLVAILLLQTVDYIEHYGLTRGRNPETGHYEAFKAHHSWDSPQALTNFALMNLALHSHHHQKASLPFTALTPQEGARRLPYGYSTMALLALVPPLFFRKMNPLLERSLTLSENKSPK